MNKRIIVATILCAVLLVLSGCNGKKYKDAMAQFDNKQYEEAAALFESLEDYKDSAEMVKKCNYQMAMDLLTEGDTQSARPIFIALGDFDDSMSMVLECDYLDALDLLNNKDYINARKAFEQLADYKDSSTMVEESYYQNGMDYLERGETGLAMEELSYVCNYKDSKSVIAKTMINSLDDYLSELEDATESFNSLEITIVSKAIKTLLNTGTVSTSSFKADENDSDYKALKNSRTKIEGYIAEYNQIFNEEVMARCDDELRSFKKEFDAFANYAKNYYSDGNITAFTNKLFTLYSTKGSVDSAFDEYNKKIENFQKACEKLSRL